MTRMWLWSHCQQILKSDPWLSLFPLNFLPKIQSSPASCLQRPFYSRGPEIFSPLWGIAVSSLGSHTAAILSSDLHKAELSAPRCSQARFNRAGPSSCGPFLGNPHWSLGISTLLYDHQPSPTATRPGRLRKTPPRRGKIGSLQLRVGLPGSPRPICVHTPACPTCT